MKKLFLFSLLMLLSQINAQQFILGKVTTDVDTKVANVIVFNLRTEQQTMTDKDGFFIIKASTNDELRFIKNNFERVIVKVKAEDFSKPMNISIQPLVIDIGEIKLGFKPTGNLKRDSRALDLPKKIVELNESLASSMKTPPKMAYPSNKMPSTIAMGPNFSAGQISLFSTGGNGGLLGSAIGLVKNKVNPKTEPNFAETQDFYRRVKESVDMKFFIENGIDEYTFERLLAYVDQKYNLTKNYRSNFNRIAIENILKSEVDDFLDTRMPTKKQPS